MNRRYSLISCFLVASFLTTCSIATWSQAAPNTFCQWSGDWSNTASMSQARAGATATLLTIGPNAGQVLIAGGSDFSSNTSTADLYNPTSGTYAATGSMAQARYFHTATLLQDGRVLVVGGLSNGGFNNISSAELYDPSTGTFSSAGSMSAPRYDHTATLLNDGTVLVTGGHSWGPMVATAELYIPPQLAGNSTGSWMSLNNMGTPRAEHTATLLSDGRVLIAGGRDNGYNPLASAEIFDPGTRTFANTGSMHFARYNHTGTATAGTPLIVGGYGPTGYVASAETYSPSPNPALGLFFTAGSLITPRDSHTATLLADGKILIIGGESTTGVGITPAELWDPDRFAFVSAGNMLVGRIYHTATLLANGNVLLTGGLNYSSGSGVNASSEIYNTFSTVPMNGQLRDPRQGHTATLLTAGIFERGQVLLAGGSNGGMYVGKNTSEFFNPSTNSFSSGPSLNVARLSHTATPLPNGAVLIAGGYNTGSYLSSAELYNPSGIQCFPTPFGRWRCFIVGSSFSVTGSLLTARRGHTATYIPSINKVLIAGGYTANGITASAELYDPTSGQFTAAGSMVRDRTLHTATLIHIGGAEKVLITGGYSNAVSGISFSVEIYDPATGTFTLQPQSSFMLVNREAHQATLLGDGRVLITGGLTSGYTPTATAEIYDPSLGRFIATKNNMTSARWYHTATLTDLDSGKVLVAGGTNMFGGSGIVAQELWDPATNSFSAIENLRDPRMYHTATLMSDGRILFAGGQGGAVSNGTGEVTKSTLCGPPNITGVNPPSASVGSAITITGSYFGVIPGTVVIGGYGANILNWSANSIQVQVPNTGGTPPISTTLYVTVNAVQSNSVAFTIN